MPLYHLFRRGGKLNYPEQSASDAAAKGPLQDSNVDKEEKREQRPHLSQGQHDCVVEILCEKILDYLHLTSC